MYPPICVNRICFLTFYVYIAIYIYIYIFFFKFILTKSEIYAYIYIHVYILCIYIYILKNLQPAHALRYSHSAGGWGNLEASPPSGIEGLVITRRVLKSILVSMHVPRWQPTRNSRQSKVYQKGWLHRLLWNEAFKSYTVRGLSQPNIQMSIPHPQWQFWWSIWDSQIISYKNCPHIYKYIFKSTCSSQGLSSSLCTTGAGALRWSEGGRNWQASDQGSLPWDRAKVFASSTWEDWPEAKMFTVLRYLRGNRHMHCPAYLKAVFPREFEILHSLEKKQKWAEY